MFHQTIPWSTNNNMVQALTHPRQLSQSD
jgi:hypothetical protein